MSTGRDEAPATSATLAATIGTSNIAFPSSEEVSKFASATHLHGLDLKNSVAVCEHFLKFGHFLFSL